MGQASITDAPETVPTRDRLVEIGLAAGLSAVGVAAAEIQQPARQVLHLRKEAGLSGTMQLTYRNPDRSTDPASVLPSARSMIVGAWPYGRWQVGPYDEPADRARARVARYAWHDHYADLAAALQMMAAPLRAAGHKAVVVADSNGLVDRNAAWSAGLGWYGKSTNLLLPEAGSWFVLGAVLTNAELEPTGQPKPDGCGPCTACIDDCPTGAIVAPGVVDATRCLAWLVQADGWFPQRWREALGDRIYGCDDCQDVCPPNRATPSGIGGGQEPGEGRGEGEGEADGGEEADPAQAMVDLNWLLTASDEEILDRHGRWYIAGRRVDHVRRSALVALGNAAEPGHFGVIDVLRRHLASPEPILRGHAVWAARRLGLDAIATAAADDPSPEVRAELATAVTPRFPPDAWDLQDDAVPPRAGTL